MLLAEFLVFVVVLVLVVVVLGLALVVVDAVVALLEELVGVVVV